MSIIRPEDDKRITPLEIFNQMTPAARTTLVLSALWGTGRVLWRARHLAKAIIPTARTGERAIQRRALQPRRSRRAGVLRFSRKETRRDAFGQFYEEDITYTIEYGEAQEDE